VQRSGYIQSGGAKGHIMDMRFIGGYRFDSTLLLHYTDRKSGKQYISAALAISDLPKRMARTYPASIST